MPGIFPSFICCTVQKCHNVLTLKGRDVSAIHPCSCATQKVCSVQTTDPLRNHTELSGINCWPPVLLSVQCPGHYAKSCVCVLVAGSCFCVCKAFSGVWLWFGDPCVKLCVWCKLGSSHLFAPGKLAASLMPWSLWHNILDCFPCYNLCMCNGRSLSLFIFASISLFFLCCFSCIYLHC